MDVYFCDSQYTLVVNDLVHCRGIAYPLPCKLFVPAYPLPPSHIDHQHCMYTIIMVMSAMTSSHQSTITLSILTNITHTSNCHHTMCVLSPTGLSFFCAKVGY